MKIDKVKKVLHLEVKKAYHMIQNALGRHGMKKMPTF